MCTVESKGSVPFVQMILRPWTRLLSHESISNFQSLSRQASDFSKKAIGVGNINDGPFPNDIPPSLLLFVTPHM